MTNLTVNKTILGLGLRIPYFQSLMNHKPALDFLEVHSENYFIERGQAFANLIALRKHYAISLHGVNLSIASSDELNWQHLKHLKALIDMIEPNLVSDHLCWSSINGQYLHELLPFPYNDQTLAYVSERVLRVQDYLQRPLLIENIARYIDFSDSIMSEAEFLAALVAKTGCQLLLDISNLYINSINFHFDAKQYLKHLPLAAIAEIHLAGFSEWDQASQRCLIDSHDRTIATPVFELYRLLLPALKHVPTLLEWDQALPSFSVIYRELLLIKAFIHDPRLIS
jgi:uncharacterized protein